MRGNDGRLSAKFRGVRIVERFLLFPRRLRNYKGRWEWRWMKRAAIERRFVQMRDGRGRWHLEWHAVRLVDESSSDNVTTRK